MGVIVNLDENPNFVSQSTLTQDFRETHSRATFIFISPEKFEFGEGDTIQAWGFEWEAVSYKEVDRGSEFFYSVLGYPVGVCSVVDKKFLNMSSLANSLGTRLEKDSTDFDIPFPLHNILLGPLLYKYRWESVEHNINNPDQAWFLFFDERGLISKTYSGMSRGSIMEFDMDMLSDVGGHYTFIRDALKVRYNNDHYPSPLSYQNYVGGLIGDKYDITGVIPGAVGERYKLSGTEENKFSKYDKLILVRQKYDSKKRPLPWVLTFGQLEV